MKFHQFTGKTCVRLPTTRHHAPVVVEVHEHRRAVRDGSQQLRERSHRMWPNDLPVVHSLDVPHRVGRHIDMEMVGPKFDPSAGETHVCCRSHGEATRGPVRPKSTRAKGRRAGTAQIERREHRQHKVERSIRNCLVGKLVLQVPVVAQFAHAVHLLVVDPECRAADELRHLGRVNVRRGRGWRRSGVAQASGRSPRRGQARCREHLTPRNPANPPGFDFHAGKYPQPSLRHSRDNVTKPPHTAHVPGPHIRPSRAVTSPPNKFIRRASSSFGT